MSMGKKVLLVEDDPLLIKLYTTKFESERIPYDVARDGEEGFQKVLVIRPCVVLMDIMMPKLNGLDALKALRQHPECVSVPVFILTNVSQESVAREALDFGANGFFIKTDLTPTELVEKISTYL